MKVLVIGGGGREHALAWMFARDSSRPDIFCAPGNGGTAGLGVNLDIDAGDTGSLLNWARRERPDLTVVGPEGPLCAGLVDDFQAEKLCVFGPCKAAARLEGSKVFAKEVLRSAGVRTGGSQWFDDPGKALAYLDASALPIVVKADGLAAGKGVSVCYDRDEARQAVRRAMIEKRFGPAGEIVLIEEYLEGEEVSMIALVDGEHAAMLPSARDHKRALNGDSGPNTGGMGAYSPAPLETEEFREEVMREIMLPTLKELGKRGIRYRGALYAGLIMTPAGPSVLEFNCRFGDPETQAVLPRLNGDLIPALQACINGALKQEDVAFRPESCVCVVMAAGGYPGSYQSGDAISGLADAGSMEDVVVFHAGTRMEDGGVFTAGGRVLGVTALGPDLKSAVERAYEAVSGVGFRNAHFRTDIASEAAGQEVDIGY